MIEMADILRRYAEAYRAKFSKRIPNNHNRAIDDIIRCRTREMGGKIYECPEHHEVAYKYHSCMNHLGRSEYL